MVSVSCMASSVPFGRPGRYGFMNESIDPTKRDELFELYSELHLACGRAVAALHLASNRGVSEDERLNRFRKEEATAAGIWRRIQELRIGG